MRIKLLREAKIDLLRARDFYDSQEFGLGDYFVDVMTSEIDALAWYGGVHAVYRGYYKAVVRKFPYSIYYKVVEDLIKVYAILDNRRDPLWIVERLSK